MRRLPRDTLVAALLGALCLLALAVDAGQPLVRNSLVYARAAEHVIAHGYDPRPVVADSTLSYDKPVLFAWSAAPLVAVFGNHLGLMLASTLGTLAMIAASLQLLRTVLPAPDDERLRARALLFAMLSPLAVYQTWSAHPDALETALTSSALAQAWSLTARPDAAPRRRALLLAATLEAGILLKNYGLVLLVALPLAFLPRLVICWRSGRRTVLRWLLGAWCALGGLTALAFFERNPLQRLVGEGGGAAQYGRGAWLASAGGALLALLLTLVQGLHVVLPFACCAPRQRRLGPLLAFAALYTACLLPFPNSYYNMRYFLPVLPVAGLLAALGIERAARAAARAAMAVFAVVALALVAVFDVAPLHAAVAPFLPEWRLRGAAMPGMLDNLRMPLHREQRAWLDRLDAALPAGAVVYMVDFGYYRDAQHGVYERGGRIRSDVTTRYVPRRDLQPAEDEFFVCFGARPDRALLERFGAVEMLYADLFRVRRD